MNIAAIEHANVMYFETTFDRMGTASKEWWNTPRGLTLNRTELDWRAAMQSTERWMPVVGYEGAYEVSDQGRVRSVDRSVLHPDGAYRHVPGRILKQTVPKNPGYPKVGLSLNGVVRTARVHRIVAESFVPGQAPGLEVCHGDGDRLNPRAENLRWGTRRENVMDTVRHGRNPSTRKTHCPAGHAYDAANTSVINGSRYCRACRRVASKRGNDARRAGAQQVNARRDT